VAVEQPPRQHAAILGAFNRTTADDERDRLRQRICDGTGEWITPAGYEGDVNASVDRLVDGVAVRLRDMPFRVEKGPVDVDSNEPDHALGSILDHPGEPSPTNELT
jgi:hypothetical protein